MTGDLSLGEVQIQYIYMYILLVENLWISKSWCSSMLSVKVLHTGLKINSSAWWPVGPVSLNS